jgi:hypothetical protein
MNDISTSLVEISAISIDILLQINNISEQGVIKFTRVYQIEYNIG